MEHSQTSPGIIHPKRFEKMMNAISEAHDLAELQRLAHTSLEHSPTDVDFSAMQNVCCMVVERLCTAMEEFEIIFSNSK